MYSGTQLFLIHAGLFFSALLFSLLVNSVFMRFFRTFGIREEGNGTVRWAASAKPAFGGIGFFIIFLGAFAVNGALFPKYTDPLQAELIGLLASTGLGFLMGLADDAYNTRPVLKFFTQMACALLLIASGTSIHIFEAAWANQLLTVIWVVGMMNSINMLDNMDGITTVVSLFILAAGLLHFAMNGPRMSIDVVLIIGVMAALTGFLFYNWNPSRMFMGDTVSQFLGVFLAYVGIRCFWNGTGHSGIAEPWRQASVTLIVFLLPIADTTTVTITRMVRGRSPFVGGKDHTTHHLSYAGLSDGQVALTFAALGGVALLLTFVELKFIAVWQHLHSVIYVGYALIVAGLLYAQTKRTMRTP